MKDKFMTTKTLQWVIAHEPVDLFLAAATRFADEVFEKTNGQYKIEISTLTEYNNRKKLQLNFQDLVSIMDSDVELSQMYTYILGNYHKDFWTIDMPYIFKDHDHAARVFEGSIGKKMLNDLSKKSTVRGLAFTYSGGYKCIPSNVELQTVADFMGTKIRTSNNPVSHDIFEMLGATPVDMPIEHLAHAGEQGSVDCGESTFIRIFASGQNRAFRKVCEADHALLATSIIISNKFWNSLTLETQEIFYEAALNTARIERRDSIENVNTVKARCAKEGIEVQTMSMSERNKLKLLTDPLYDKYNDFFEDNLLSRIKST
jgi:TRAP-type C4-dicarboxylate transport system substrate-binding protein